MIIIMLVFACASGRIYSQASSCTNDPLLLAFSFDVTARINVCRVRSGIMSIVLFQANILLHIHPISST